MAKGNPALDGATSLTHATCIALDGRGALLIGPSGSGKSDLALRCLTSGGVLGQRALRASLVADDCVVVKRQGKLLTATAPQQIRGKLEVRGHGIIDVPHTAEAELVLVVQLVASGQVERLPDPQPEMSLLGVAVPVLHIAPFEASAPEKVLIALADLSG